VKCLSQYFKFNVPTSDIFGGGEGPCTGWNIKLNSNLRRNLGDVRHPGFDRKWILTIPPLLCSDIALTYQNCYKIHNAQMCY